MVYAMLEVDAEDDQWNTMPNEIKQDVEAAIVQADQGLVLTHQQVKEKYAQ